MKRYIYTLSVIIAAFSVSGCESDLPNNLAYKSYEWALQDVNPGSWKGIIVTANDINVKAPLDNNDPTYLVEIDNLNSRVKSILPKEREIAEYWTNNPAIRWNEIARELVAKYNLAPVYNADGTYPVPSAANPSAYPQFPFAHPPYASRMYSYLGVAMYEATLNAWKLKYQYNKPSASSKLVGVTPAIKDNNIPSYPSHGAAVAIAAQRVLTAMFPLEKDYLAAKAKEYMDILIPSGQNVQQDIDAGVVLGNQIADVALRRASTDGMSRAQTTLAVADSIKAAAKARFGWSFENKEIPERKVGLVARFGQVRPWVTTDITQYRPLAPPAPNSDAAKKDIDELVNIANNMTKEQRKIAYFWADGTNTYTPPGHWNRLAGELIVEAKLNPLRSARVLAYLNMAIMDAGIGSWDTKYYYHYPRPNQLIPGFKTLLGTPNFPGYTSGHSTFSGAAAEVLAYVFPEAKAKVDQFALEASESRIYGGIHFRFDCEAGLSSGRRIGKACADLAAADGSR